MKMNMETRNVREIASAHSLQTTLRGGGMKHVRENFGGF